MRRARSLTALALALSATAAHVAAAAPEGWSPPATVQAGAIGAPDLAAAPTGDAVAVWRTGNTDGAMTIRVSHRLPDGTWAPSALLTTIGANATPPRVAIGPGGEAVAVFGEVLVSGATRLRVAWRPAGGAWETTAQTISASGDGGVVSSPDVAVDHMGRATVSWTQGASLAARSTWVRTGTRTGAWGAITRLSEFGVYADETRVGVDADGDVTTVWTEQEPGALEVRAASRAATGQWPAVADTALVHAGGGAGLDLSVAPNGAASAAWHGPVNGEFEVHVADRAPAGGWGPAVRVTDLQDLDAVFPQVSRDASGRTAVAWRHALTDDPGDTTRTVFVKVRNAGGLWPVFPVSPPADTSLAANWFALTTTGDGRVVVAWVASGGATGVWTLAPGATAGTRTGFSGATSAYAATGDGSGNAVLLYRDGSTRAAVLDRTPPAVALTQGPGALLTGETGTFAATAADAWSPVALTWDLGDGTAASGSPVTHAFSTPGVRTVTATATDAAGNTAADSLGVAVTAPPAAAGPGQAPGAPVATAPAAAPGGRRLLVGLGLLGPYRTGRPVVVRVTTSGPARVTAVLQTRTGRRLRAIRSVTVRRAAAGRLVVRMRPVPAGRYRLVVRAGAETRTAVVVVRRR